MEQVLEALCQVFDAELERQQSVQSLVATQRAALLSGDRDTLEQTTQDIEHVIRNSVAAESERSHLVQELVDAYGLPPERHTLTGLIEVAPEPWRSRMAHFQGMLQSTLDETRRTVTDNNRLLRQSARWTQSCLDIIIEWAGEANTGRYDARGQGPAQVPCGPAMLDQKG
ncbi:MAG: flagellar protein FlgN [Candidatus Hydrogenedentota bacterium]